MSAELGAVVIFDENLYRPGGMVHRWMTKLCADFEIHAKTAAPERSGDLRLGITSEAVPFGVKQMRGTIASNAPHSLYVLRGTTGPIMSTKAYRNPGGAFKTGWAWRDPHNGRISRTKIPGVKRQRHNYAQKGFWLAVGKQRLYPPILVRFAVAGQAPNNFLFAAWNATARTHPSLRGLAPNASIVEFP